jgi:plastocyanin
MEEDTSPWAGIWDQALDLTSRFVMPAWDTLLQYLPLLLIGLLGVSLLGIVWGWRRNTALNRSRVPAALPAGPVPEGVHLPPGSIWPFIAPIGMFLVFLSLALGGGESGMPVNLALASVGVIVFVLAAAGWYFDANREYDTIEAHEHGLSLPAHAEAASPRTETIPEGVHLPGPSAWPFLAPIGLVFMFLGLVLGPLLIVGGAFMAIAAGLGWYIDANREFEQVEATGHAPEPVTRDPVKVFPRWAAPTFAAVGGFVILLTLFPWFLSLIPEQAAGNGDAGPPPTTTPFLSASTATHFDQGRIVIPADTPVTLTFQNDQAGVPHDVAVADPAAEGEWLFNGEDVTGVATIEYQLPPFAAGEYTFHCTIHPPMVGTVLVREAPPAPA